MGFLFFTVSKNHPKKRFVMGRRFARGWLLIVIVLVTASGAAAFFALPYVARVRVTNALRSKLGVETTIDAISVGLFSVALHNTKIKTSSDDAVTLKIERVVVHANLINLIFEGVRGVRSIEGHGIDMAVDLQQQSLNPTLDRLFSREGIARTQTRSSRKPGLSVDDVSLTIRDLDRTLVFVKVRVIRYASGSIVADFDLIDLGSEPHTAVTIEDISISAARADGGFRLQRAVVGNARVTLEEQTALLTESTGDKGKNETTVKTKGTNTHSPSASNVSPRDKAEKDDSATSPDADEQPPSENNETKTLDRLLYAVRLLRSSHGAQKDTKDLSTDKAVENRESVYSWLTKDAFFELKNASIGVREKEGPRIILKDLRGEAKGNATGGIQIKGKGSAQEGGAFSADMTIWPDELRADGRVSLESLPLALIAPLLPEIPWYMPEQSRVDAQLVLNTQSVERIEVSGRAHVEHVAVYSEKIAPHPIGDIDFAVQGKGHFLPLKRRLEIDEATIGLGKAKALLSGAVEWTHDHYLFDIDARLPSTKCDVAVSAIPRDLLEELVGFEWKGSIEGGLKLQIDSRALDNAVMKIDVKDHCEFTMVPELADLRRFKMPFIHTVTEPDGTEFSLETGPGTTNWTYLEDISPFFVHAVLSHEDVQFFQHAGFSPLHIRNALVRDLQEGRYVVGASTITMQLVKNLFLKREKTLARKVQEVLLTWWVERVLEKKDILELYLNVIEYGPGIYGIRNGARHYFNRSPSELSPAESIYLSMILPNPKLYHYQFERGSISPSWKERMAQAMKRMGDRGWYTKDAMQFGLQEIENFHFYPEDEPVPSRKIPGGTSLLPYMEASNNPLDLAEKGVGKSK
jgi:hypothetical protein